MPEDERAYRSVSQANQYARCPYSYKLSRIDKAWARPAAWLPQGSAVHSVAESFWRSTIDGTPMTREELHQLFEEEYSQEVGYYCEDTPNFDYWFPSGRYRGAEDIVRRYSKGLEQIDRFIAWANKHPEERIWITPEVKDPRCTQCRYVWESMIAPVHVPDCECKLPEPALELAFEMDLDGVLVRGYIDAVIVVEDELRVRDYKTGKNPGDDFQLAVYAIALGEMYGIEPPRYGDYWMGQTGKPTIPYDLSEWTRDKVAARFRELDDDIRAERFEPKPSPDNCRFCSVSAACDYRES